MSDIDEIIAKFDALKVPGTGLTWARVCAFAVDYHDDYERFELPDELDIALAEVEGQQPPTTSKAAAIKLSDDQETAWLKLVEWLKTDARYFVLQGYAGTGKTYLLQLLNDQPHTFFFTAPTNKATKVLGRAVGVDTRTTYSQLGLRMQQDDGELKMAYGENAPYMPKGSILVVDEASMIGSELYDFIDDIAAKARIKVLYVGDPAQLPPVGEIRSRSWKSTAERSSKAALKQVMRYDNELLKLATRIRDQMRDKEYDYPVENDNSNGDGVFLLASRRAFKEKLMEYTEPSDFQTRKVIGWRNKTVNMYNDLIRAGFGFKKRFEIGDVLLMADPVEEYGEIVASVDDEFTVQAEEDREVKVHMGEGEEPRYVKVHQLAIKETDTNRVLSISVPHDYTDVQRILDIYSNRARNSNGSEKREAWKAFWEIKGRFTQVRYGYALTAHRAQGSTYTEVFVDQMDILANKNKREAFRCLYVAATRPTTRLYTY